MVLDSALPIEYDGVSHALKIVAPIKPGEVNSILIGVADTGDHILDSGIFISNLSAGNTPGSGVVLTPDVPCTDDDDVVTGSVADEFIELRGGNDSAYAGGGDDIVVAGAGNDSVYGGSGNDVLEGNSGDDYLDGGEGCANEAVYSGISSAYAISFDGISGTFSINGQDGHDTLRSVQLVRFSDGLYDLTTTGLVLHSGNTGTPDNQAGSVMLSGASIAGQTLVAHVLDADGVSGASVLYDWLYSTDGGNTWTSTEVTNQAYALTDADAGRQIMVSVSYDDLAVHQESATSNVLSVAAKADLAISLVQLSAPAGAGVENTLTTLLSNAIALGFTANEASLAIKSVLSLPDISLKTYDAVALLTTQPADPTALQVLKICGQLAMLASASDPSALNLTLAVMQASAQGHTIDLSSTIEIASLLSGVDPTVLDIVQGMCNDMQDAKNVDKVLAVWDDFCGNTDGMEEYQGTFTHFNRDLNQCPEGNGTATLAFGSVDTPYTLMVSELLAGFLDPDADALSITGLQANTGGSFVDNADGSWTFTPEAGFFGPVEIAYTVCDPLGLSANGVNLFVMQDVVTPPVLDATAPTVSSVSYGSHDGILKAGETVTLVVTLSEAVDVTGTPILALANGASACYSSGSGTNTLTFSYTAAAAEDTADLASALSGALSGAITDAAGNAVLATGFDGVNPGGTLAVDTTAPTVSSVSYGSHDGTLKAGEMVTLLFTLSEVVGVTGTPSLILANGASATYSSGSGTNTLTFSYSAAAAEDTTDLATALSGAFSGAITDAAGNAVLATGFDAVNPSGTLVVDTTAATVTAFSPADGASLVAVASNISLTFSETMVRGTGFISLRSGSATGALVESFDVATSNRIAIVNSVLMLDPTHNLATNTQYFLVVDNGALRDLAGNAFSGTNTYDFRTVPAGKLITGTANADLLTGTAAVDLMTGLGGNDTLVGAAGTDIMDGGEGSDLYLVALAGDHAAVEFADSGLTGVDEVRFTSTVTSSTLSLFAGDQGIERVVIGTGTAAAATGTATTALNVNAGALSYGVGLVGNAGANALTGGLGDDSFTGNAGLDTFNITAGTDAVTDLGNGGADVLNVSLGATANATVSAAWTASASTVNKGTVNIATNGLAVNLAAVKATNVGNLGYHVTNIGAATTLTGSALGDWLTGAAGNDTLVGGSGTDALNGGNGSDLYIVALAGDHAAAEFADSGLAGVDEVRFTSTVAGSTLSLFAGDQGIERVVIGTGIAAAATGTATTALNVNAGALSYGVGLVGNAGANAFTSGLGDDSFTGNAGLDTFNITAGTDAVTDLGNGGADVLNVSLGATANATVSAAWTASASTVNKGTVNIATNGLAVNLAAVKATNAGNLGYHVTNIGAATTLTGSALGDWLTGAAGNDTLVGGSGTDALNGGNGSDLYIVALAGDHAAAEFADSGLAGVDEVCFTSTVAGSTLSLFAGDQGIERVVIGTGIAAVATGTATTALNVNAGALSYGVGLVGNAGANALTGGLGDDTLLGGAGNDVLVGGAGNDLADYSTATAAITANLSLTIAQNTGAAGTDTLSGIEGIAGGSASDTLTGDINDNTLIGNTGNDSLNGGAGFDQLRGGNGNDVLTGGADNDWFIFDTAANATSNRDTVNDFVSGVDVLQFSRGVFTGLSSAPLGALNVNTFWSGANTTAAHDATDRFIYNTTTGALYYDADGIGGAAAIQVALLAGTIRPTLTYADFAVI